MNINWHSSASFGAKPRHVVKFQLCRLTPFDGRRNKWVG